MQSSSTRIWSIFSSIESEHECAEVVKGIISSVWIPCCKLSADSPVMEEHGEWVPVSRLHLTKPEPCSVQPCFRSLLWILVWLLFDCSCFAHQLRTVWETRVAAGTVGPFVNEGTFCNAPLCSRPFLEEGYPEDQVHSTLTVENRPPGGFQAISLQIGHALGGNDPRRQ